MKKKLLIILGAGLFFSFFIGGFTHDFGLAFKFGLAYFLLYYLPVVPWMLLVKELSDLDAVFYSIILGIIVSPLFYLAVGALEFRLTKITFIAIPLVIFAIGVLMHFRKKKTVEKSQVQEKPIESPKVENENTVKESKEIISS
jgi:hypothetical protein